MYKSISFNPIERQTITYPFTFLHGALAPEECKKIIETYKNGNLVRSVVGGGETKSTNEAVRRSNVNFVSFNDDNRWLFEKLADIVGGMNEQFYNFNLNGFPNFQFTEYLAQEDGHYDWHIDCFLGDPDPMMQAIRKLSMSILLNDDFEGGQLQLHVGNAANPIVPETKQGTAILFPSFVSHRVIPVTKGSRYSLVVWVYGPKFI